jgi:hypothetical protein
MKIAIIGGGWVGCHLAAKLFREHDVSLYEKNQNLFQETSYNNQNRLHLGYHYARSFKTRELCKNTFDRFLSEYSFLVKDVPNNWYCIESSKSIVDYGTYLQIFKGNDHYEVPNIFKNVEGVLNTNEKQIDFEAAYEFFNYELGSLHIQSEISKQELKSLSKRYDLVIDCTNNHLEHKHKTNSFFETTVSYLYKKIKPTPFDAITMVDGDFFSIYPYKDDLYTVTDVKHTPIKRFKSSKPIKKYNEAIKKNNFLLNNSKEIEKKILKYYPEFLDTFKYNGYFLSTKSKIISGSDHRYPIIVPKNNIIHCFTGKIQGIYIIEDYITSYINNFYDDRTTN